MILSLSVDTRMPEVSHTAHNLAQKFEFVFLQQISERIDFPYILLEHL